MEQERSVPPSSVVNVVASDSGKAVGTATLRVRSTFAVQHFMAAARFARRSAEIESSHASAEIGPFFDEIVSYVSASILSSAAGLEAGINELFLDADVHFPEYKQGAAGNLWDFVWEGIERQRTLEKYDSALSIKKKPRFAKDTKAPDYAVFRAASTLVDVRNALIHFKPQWDDEEKSHRALTRALLREGVQPSSFYTPATFPMGFMSKTTAQWAVTTSMRFIGAFSQGAGIDNKFTNYLDQMNPGDDNWPNLLS